MFALCLDDFAYTGPDDCMKQHIAGKSHNRWPEKSFMIVMGHCGKAGVVFEHAWGDGAAVLHFMNSVNHHTTEIVQGDFEGPPLAADTLKPSGNGIANEIKFKVILTLNMIHIYIYIYIYGEPAKYPIHM